VQHAITVKAGDTVHFVNPASTGGTHVLCLGKDQTCSKGAAGPDKFADPGVTTNPGDPSLDVVFPTAGTYEITCTVHQNMNVTITVQ
jgi:plastocyanin